MAEPYFNAILCIWYGLCVRGSVNTGILMQASQKSYATYTHFMDEHDSDSER